jgi:hypothetical protein
MANEYLQRTPTSTGNTRVWTWSGWLKLNDTAAAPTNIFMARTIAGGADYTYIDSNAGEIRFADDAGYANNTTRKIRDSSGWFHLLCNLNTTSSSGDDRMNIYINGALESNLSSASNPVINYQATVNTIILHTIGNNSNGQYGEYNITDVFLVDGQALTPDVFGFNKQGKGYISAGSTQATDFRPGQWVPKTPRVIKTEINRRGGFGVNGFYLPMNDSRNFGADFHGDPNSIITLNEKLPQPRVGVASTASVGLGYTDALRADPYAANLVLALPFVSGGLSSGFGDYAPSIKGSGSAKTITNNTSVSIANTHGYYGNAAYIDSVNYLTSSSSDYAMGTGDFTVEGWINQTGGDTTNGGMFSSATSDGSGTGIVVARDQCWLGNNSVAVSVAAPGGTFWPLNQWTHIAFVRKTNIISVFVNGVASGITTNVTSNVGKTDISIGRRYYNNSSFTPIAYIQDLRVYKGVAKYTGGFDVPRPYTPVGIATWRQVPDTTANNFATMNPLIGAVPRSGGTITSTIVTYTDGNLTTRNSANAGYAPAMQSHSNVGMTTGKWYWEVSNFSTTSNETTGISKGNQQISPNGSGTGIESYLYYFSNTGVLTLDLNTPVVSATLNNSPGVGISSTADVIGFAFDVTNGSLSVYRNGVLNNTATGIAVTSNVREWFTTKSAGGSSSPSGMSWNFGQNPTFSGNTTAGTFTDTNGKGLFKYQPPSGFLALCEDNLPTPAISDPGKYFRSVLYTGDGASGRSIVGVGFTPDLVWIKARSAATVGLIYDSIRGSAYLQPSNTQAEVGNDLSGLTSYNSDGFSIGNGGAVNTSNQTQVAWCWRVGAGTTSTNTNGSITSVVSVNQDAGFSIVSYTGTGSAGTVGHGLGKAPSFIIIKRRSGISDWAVYHKTIGTTGALLLNLTSATDTNRLPYWNDTVPTITTLGLGNGNNVNASSSNYIAYCWAEIEGFSKFGSYVGNGNADGPFVYCGFKPALIIIKCSSDTENWYMYDSSRKSYNDGSQHSLFPNLTDIESTGWPIDFLSNGFKNRYVGATNNSGRTYIFAAWAESPFTTANAK